MLVGENGPLDRLQALAVRLDDLRNVEGDRSFDRLSERTRADGPPTGEPARGGLHAKPELGEARGVSRGCSGQERSGVVPLEDPRRVVPHLDTVLAHIDLDEQPVGAASGRA